MRLIHIGIAVLILLAIGIIRFSRAEPAKVCAIELSARLEAFQLMQRQHFAKHEAFFDPRTEPHKNYLGWLTEHKCEVRWSEEAFSITARADFDADGEQGVWRVDNITSAVVMLSED